jgi:putative membrane protein
MNRSHRFLLCLALLGCGTAWAQNATSGKPHADEHFAREVSNANNTEIMASQIALQNSQADDVKQFARRMIDDHGMAETQLKSIASSENLQLPTKLPSHTQSELDRLMTEHGAQFDHAFAHMMLMDHRQAVAMFKQSANNQALGQSLRDFATMTLPTLQTHLRLARQLAAAHGGANKEPASSSG